MAMTVSYSVVPRKNPAKKSEPAKYYAQAQASGELDFEELCEAITSRSTCTETDVRAAISGILYEVKRALKAGRIARLGDLGSLQIGLNSEGAASVKEFSGSMIKGASFVLLPESVGRQFFFLVNQLQQFFTMHTDLCIYFTKFILQ